MLRMGRFLAICPLYMFLSMHGKCEWAAEPCGFYLLAWKKIIGAELICVIEYKILCIYRDDWWLFSIYGDSKFEKRKTDNSNWRPKHFSRNGCSENAWLKHGITFILHPIKKNLTSEKIEDTMLLFGMRPHNVRRPVAKWTVKKLIYYWQKKTEKKFRRR